MRYPNVDEIIGIVIFLLIVFSVYRAHKNPSVDFNALDLLMENGKVSKLACLTMGGFAALTYVFIGTYLSGKMTEAWFMSYGTMCFAPVLLRMFSPAAQSSEKPS